LEAAHRVVRADKSLQWELPTVPPEPPERAPPGWLGIFDVLGPLLELVFWGGLIAIAGLAVWLAVREGERRWRDRAVRTARTVPVVRPPGETRVRALLAEADRLAAEGRYAEAVHALLFRGVDDIRDQRPELFRRALTSREIAALAALPERPRAEFGRIAQVVEESFFGGRPVDAGGFADCRRAYEAFADPGGWRTA
jgi:hypothetical protein